MLCCPAALAQVTKVRGLVVDDQTGEPLPYVSVFFTGTTIGVATDMDGRYYMETRDTSATELQATLIGYKTAVQAVSRGAFSEINFTLEPNPDELSASVIKPDRQRMRNFLKRLDESRILHNPNQYYRWGVQVYTRMELDAANSDWMVNMPLLKSTLAPIAECRDTSTVSGVAYYPALISETISHQYHDLNGPVDKEIIEANRITGVESDNFMTQYTGNYLLRANLYENTIDLFNLQVPSPIAAYGHPFYDYYLVDSLMVDGRKTYCLRFHPKAAVTSPTLDGQVDVDAQDYSIRSARVRLSDKSNVNWIRHIDYSMDYRLLPEGQWFPKEEAMFIDFSIAASDSSKVQSFLARRQQVYEEPVFGETIPEKYAANGDPVINESVGRETDWDACRAIPLTPKEEKTIAAVEKIQNGPSYNALYAFIRSLVVGYVEMRDAPVGFGPWARTLTYNPIEGIHIGTGFRTTRYFNQKLRLAANVGYGFKDREIKGAASVEYTIRRDKTRKIWGAFTKDYVQLGQGFGALPSGSIFNSFMGRSNERQSLVMSSAIGYEHEFSRVFSLTGITEHRRVFGNEMVPLALPDETILPFIDAAQIHFSGRFAWDERIHRGFFEKAHIFTKYPVLTFDIIGGSSFIGNGTDEAHPYLRTEVSLNWNAPGTPVGFSTFRVNAGKIYGRVPYLLLKLHEGNQGWFWDNTAFTCMDYFEYASDQWMDVFLEHNFDGLLLGHIPLLKKLDLREIVSFKAAFGSLREDNGEGGLVKPISGMDSLLQAPYYEMGVGISNIFRLLRVDVSWRLTHRKPTTRNTCFTVGFDFKF